MAITRIKNSSIANRTPKYNDVLAGLPFRPVIGTATDGGNGTSVSVAFTGNNVANGTVTYTALSSPGSITATGPASPITVTGLTSGTAYTFQVKAGNSLGDSAYSGSSNSVTPVTPTAFESIASASGTGSSGTITFSSIPGTYQHLQLRVFGDATANDWIYIRFNSDTGNNYARHGLSGNGTSTNAEGVASMNATRIAEMPATTTAGLAAAIIDIHDYASTTKNTTVRSFTGYDDNGSGYVYLRSILWNNTAAVTRIDLLMASGNFSTDTRIALYGIKS